MSVDLPATILDLCAGFGMLAEGVVAGLESLGHSARVVAHVERDSAAAAALVARMEIAPLDQAPVCDDLAAFDGKPWRGIVDILCAGLPCQPYSLAGKKLGNIDHRSHGEDGDGPIPHFLRIVEECRPAVVFLENVPVDPELRRGRLPLFPPGRDDYGAWAAVAAVATARMPRVESELSVVADGLAFSRADLLRIGGNGVCTLAAAVAFVALWTEAFDRKGGAS